jgi:hypothetical protein
MRFLLPFWQRLLLTVAVMLYFYSSAACRCNFGKTPVG